MPAPQKSARKTSAKKSSKSFEESLWETATKLRGSVESSEYKHVVLSLIFLKFVSDKFEERRAELIAEMIEPYKGKIYDPCCGSGGSLPASRPCGVRFAERDRAPALGIVQSLKFVESHHGNTKDISVYGQDQWAWGAHLRRAERARRVRQRRKLPNQFTATTYKLAKMNLAVRGLSANLGEVPAELSTSLAA